MQMRRRDSACMARDCDAREDSIAGLPVKPKINFINMPPVADAISTADALPAADHAPIPAGEEDSASSNPQALADPGAQQHLAHHLPAVDTAAAQRRESTASLAALYTPNTIAFGSLLASMSMGTGDVGAAGQQGIVPNITPPAPSPSLQHHDELVCSVVGCGERFSDATALHTHVLKHFRDLASFGPTPPASVAPTEHAQQSVSQPHAQFPFDLSALPSIHGFGSIMGGAADLRGLGGIIGAPGLGFPLHFPQFGAMTALAPSQTYTNTDSTAESTSDDADGAGQEHAQQLEQTHGSSKSRRSRAKSKVNTNGPATPLSNSASGDDEIEVTVTSNGRRSHKCSYCPSTFSRGHDLKRHLFTHLKEKPFTCVRCGKGFSRRDALRRHERAVLEGARVHCIALTEEERKRLAQFQEQA